MTNEKQEKELKKIIKDCEDWEKASVPGLGQIYGTINDLGEFVAFLKLWESLKSMGAGYKKALQQYKGNFSGFKEEMEKAALDKGEFFKETKEKFVNSMKEKLAMIKQQIQDLMKSLTSLPACFANPFTITAGFPIFFAILAQITNIARAMKIFAQFILDTEFYKVDEIAEDFPEIGDSIETLDTILVDGLILLSTPFTTMLNFVGVIQDLINKLIGLGKEGLTKLQEKYGDAPKILSAATELSNLTERQNNFCGYLFECITIESEVTDSTTGETTKKEKKYQYVGCNTLVKTNITDIECTKNGDKYDLTRDDIKTPSNGNGLINIVGKYYDEASLKSLGVMYLNQLYKETNQANWLNPDNWMEI